MRAILKYGMLLTLPKSSMSDGFLAVFINLRNQIRLILTFEGGVA